MIISFFVTGADVGLHTGHNWVTCHPVFTRTWSFKFSLLPSISAKPSQSCLYFILLIFHNSEFKGVYFEEIQPKERSWVANLQPVVCLYVYKVTLRLRSRERIWMSFSLNLIKYILSSWLSLWRIWAGVRQRAPVSEMQSEYCRRVVPLSREDPCLKRARKPLLPASGLAPQEVLSLSLSRC